MWYAEYMEMGNTPLQQPKWSKKDVSESAKIPSATKWNSPYQLFLTKTIREVPVEPKIALHFLGGGGWVREGVGDGSNFSEELENNVVKR